MSKTFEVESGVPIPGGGRNDNNKYPWHDMDPGDSFLVPAGPDDRRRIQNILSSSGANYCKRHRPHLRVRTRRVEDGVRAWLVEREEGGDE